MLLKNEVTQASDVELLAAVIGNRGTAEKLLMQAGGSLFNLMHTIPEENGDRFCAQRASAYAADPIRKLQAAWELAARAIGEQLQRGDALSSPQAVRDFLKHRLSGNGTRCSQEFCWVLRTGCCQWSICFAARLHKRLSSRMRS